MSETTQTILHGDHPDVPGNCLQTAVACLLDRPLDSVPHFVTFLWWPAALELWARGEGLTVHTEDTTTIPERRCIVGGRSERGVAHVVIGEGGQVVWDPHTSRSGLVTITDVMWFEKWDHRESSCWACGKPHDG